MSEQVIPAVDNRATRAGYSSEQVAVGPSIGPFTRRIPHLSSRQAHSMHDAVICEPVRTPVGGFGGVFKDVPV
ncbi:MAG: hypothetical protein ABS976_22000, partial [Rhodococcus sp. (in: high G+C Gram-positive bacteria)]